MAGLANTISPPLNDNSKSLCRQFLVPLSQSTMCVHVKTPDTCQTTSAPLGTLPGNQQSSSIYIRRTKGKHGKSQVSAKSIGIILGCLRLLACFRGPTYISPRCGFQDDCPPSLTENWCTSLWRQLKTLGINRRIRLMIPSILQYPRYIATAEKSNTMKVMCPPLISFQSLTFTL